MRIVFKRVNERKTKGEQLHILVDTEVFAAALDALSPNFFIDYLNNRYAMDIPYIDKQKGGKDGNI